MDYSSQHGLSRFTGRKMMIFLYLFALLCNATVYSTTTLPENKSTSIKHTTEEVTKSEITKREEPEAQRREHSFNPDGTVNYHGSGSGHDSGDLVPPHGGGIFNSPSIQLSLGPTGSSGPELSNSYGVPIPSDSYGPPKNIFGPKPISSYGPPLKSSFGSSNKYLPPPKPNYGPPTGHHPPPPPKPVYGPPKPQYRPPSPPKPVYGAPVITDFTPPKPIRPKPSFSSRPKPVYGPPKQSITSGFSHGTLLSPVTSIKNQYGPPKISSTYGTPLQPSTSYGAPKHHKHGHIKAPPTPPDVKYDGWKPVAGFDSNGSGHSFGGSGHGGSFSGPTAPSISYETSSFGGTSFGSSGFGIQLKPVNTYGPPPKPSISYGTPLQPSTSYGVPISFKGGSKGNGPLRIPSSSYGVPEAPFKTTSFGSSKFPIKSHEITQISSSYGPPKFSSNSYRPPRPPSPSYGVPKAPSLSYRPPNINTNFFKPPKAPSSAYGPPSSLSFSSGASGFSSISNSHSSSFGPTKVSLSFNNFPKLPSSSYGPPKAPSSSYGPPKAPGSSYGPPKAPSSSYGPPKSPSISYGPPKAPSISYGPPKAPSSSYGPPQIFTTYTIPKPGVSPNVLPSAAYRGPSVPHPLQPPSTYGAPSFSGGLYKTPLPPNALYGVPIAPAPSTGVGCCGSSVSNFGFQGPSNVYGAPNINTHASSVDQVPSVEIGPQINQFLSAPGSPSQSYGAPLGPEASYHHTLHNSYGAPTVLPLRQPKNPVKFRPPVPAGLISSIGAKWGDSAVWGGTSNSHKFSGNTYIPPAVPDPDPGIHANQGNPLVIPPPSAPPVNYGPPPNIQHQNDHHQASNQFVNSPPVVSTDNGLNPPPPPPPPPVPNTQNTYDIQPSTSVDLPSSNTLDHHGVSDGGSSSSSHSHFSSASTTSFNAPVTITQSHDLPVSGGGSYNSGVQDIPIKGAQGSYTLQIQAAGGNSGEHISHKEVLSNGLLQDILAAIENPKASGQLEQYGSQSSNDPVASEIGLNILKQLGGSQAQQSNSVQLPTQYGSDLAHSSSINIPSYSKTFGTNNEVVQIPTISFAKNERSNGSETNTESNIAHYLNQNKIALYYNNQDDRIEERKTDEKNLLLVQMLLPNNSTDSQSQNREFGAVVSFNLQNAQDKVDATNATTLSFRQQEGDVS